MTEATNRIARNTSLVYARMLIGMVVSFYASRVILKALGVDDYGLYNVVGSFVMMFDMLSGTFAAAVSRFLNFEMGAGRENRLRQVFGVSLAVHIGIALVVLVLLESFGLWFVNHQMVIAPERLSAANSVFQASVLTFIINVALVPYDAAIVANERMGLYAFTGLFENVSRLGVILFVAYSPVVGDRLIAYAWLYAAVLLINKAVIFVFSYRSFAECRSKLCFDRKLIREMGSFAGWNAFGSVSFVLSSQGSNVLLNLVFGTAVNAARGITNTVNTVVSTFVWNFMTAINPHMTKTVASGDSNRAVEVMQRASLYSFAIMLLLAVPVMIETPFALSVWLGEYPSYSVIFIRLMLVVSMIYTFINPLATLIYATGKIRAAQVTFSMIELTVLPVSYLCYRLGGGPQWGYIVNIPIMMVCMGSRIYFAHRYADLNIREYFRHLILPAVKMAALALPLPLIVASLQDDGWVKFFTVCLACAVCTLSAFWFVGCDATDRERFAGLLGSLTKRLKLQRYE